MQIQQSFNLSHHNTFKVPAICPQYFEPSTLEELKEAYQSCKGNFYLLGEGSNTLFIDNQAPLIIRPKLMGKSINMEKNAVFLTVNCGENWHELVQYCVANNYYGIENLALIPGSVGAAPVQNIGAYGVELSDVIQSVSWFDFSQQQVIELDNRACEFGYRDSIFKQSLQGKGVIVSVTLKLAREFQPKLSYKGLSFEQKKLTAKHVMERVISIRESKLPDPKKLPNAGSFFKNPIISSEIYHTLIATYPDMPAYKVTEQTYKLAAGWLIEHAGLKGYRERGVGVHQNQALVLVNFEHVKGMRIVELATLIMEKVQEKFGILLAPEVRIVDRRGLTSISEIMV
ncbi:UDP-N-acetylmuramate dehydrogenase [Thalassotalea hakodatensis]|uniref:UDP-N-acetylmuramate dehydrogenase n=1 Tax=Thalassotalea hakodatensis TaxID=3030492 RepID=UPI0025748373|nr:UDP-N-acetylmuramate dehydrogenase [Thalassotalea hakodatensis]